MSRPLCIYAGYIVRYPLGGHALAELGYIRGLQRLGYDVIFVEESGSAWAPCYDPERNEMTAEPGFGIAELKRLLGRFGLEKNWCYVDQSGYHGLSAEELQRACRNARLLLSRAGVSWLEQFRHCKVRVFVDPDPGFTQFCMGGPSASGYASPLDFQFHFSFGQRLGRPDCPIPTHGLRWLPTRPPVALELVPVRYTPGAKYFTTVMSWTAYGSVEYEGVLYGQKDIEMLKLLELPKRAGQVFEIALAGPDAPAEKLRAAGWRVTDALAATRTLEAYVEYLGRSRGEFSVAKEGYVKTRCGWFSDRTAAYLACGKPAIVQDTGFSEIIPCGEGLFAFRTADDIVAALEEIARDYPRHCRAARELAEQYFDSDKVLGELLRACGLPVPG
jgi:hypothetical protein